MVTEEEGVAEQHLTSCVCVCSGTLGLNPSSAEVSILGLQVPLETGHIFILY